MIFKIKDKKIKKLLEKKQVLFDEIQEINKVLFEKDKERKKLTYKAQRIKEKVTSLMKKYYKNGEVKINPPLEIPTQISLKDDFIEVKVSDVVDEYKEMLIKQYKETKK